MNIFESIKIYIKPAVPLSCLLVTTCAYALQELDRIAVIVNEDVITIRELNARVDYFSRQLRGSNANVPNIEDLKKQVLEKMIRDKIQLQLATQLGINIDDVTLNRMLNQIALTNNVTLTKMRAQIESEGINFSDFRRQTRNDLIIKQLQQRLVATKVSVTDQEVTQFVQNTLLKENTGIKYHLQHILIATPEAASPDEIKKISEKTELLYEKIQDGAKFKEIAVKESSGRNALQGGDLGWREANELPEQFVEVIQELEPGETSRQIRSASGFHLIKLIERSSNNNKTVLQTHARHILIRTGTNRSDEEARKLLKEIKQKISAGQQFRELSSKYSQDPGSKDSGGDLGWTNPGSFVPAFENVMNSLAESEISEPFRSQFGWHILQVLERREQEKNTSNLQDQARKVIRNRKIEEELDLWLRRIRDEAYVEYIDQTLSQNSE